MSDGDLEQLKRDGFVVLRGFYDLEDDIAPIQEGVQTIIRLVAAKYGVDAPTSTPHQAMTEGYSAIVRADRAYGGEVYDAIKQIPPFVALVGSKRNAELFARLRPGSMPGVAAGGYGIRIDNPGEDEYRSWWHQEFPTQLRSLDGLVFWSPLVPVTPDMGPVRVGVGSHKEGVVPIFSDEGVDGRTGAYAVRMQREAEVVGRYPKAQPLTDPGDLLVLDFLVLHESGDNTSKWP
ncbi:MAG: phytanoyl-CoA dioxygenase family protein, partial [Mycobacteriales bacterium]